MNFFELEANGTKLSAINLAAWVLELLWCGVPLTVKLRVGDQHNCQGHPTPNYRFSQILNQQGFYLNLVPFS